MKKHRRPKSDLPDLDPYNLPKSWYSCVRHWKSDIVLGYIRSRPEHILKKNVEGTKATLLHMVAQCGNVILADILVHEKGMDINSESQYGGTPLFKAIRSDKEAMFRWLIDKGADITRLDSRGRTVLEETALFSSGAMIQLVLDTLKEQERELTSSTLDKALHCSLYSGRELAVSVLLNHGADPSSADGYGTTALESAAIRGHEKIVHILLDSGANPLPIDTLGRSALTCAADANCSWETTQRILEAVLIAGGDITQGHILQHFAAQACLPAVKELLSNGADVLSPNESGITALHMALYHYSENPSSQVPEDYEQVCQTLLEAINVALHNGGEFDHNLPRIEPLRGGTSLHLAAKCVSETVMRMLLDSGVDANILDLDGKSALDIATLAGHHNVARLLESRSLDQ
jgi:ankyrin repeat protein